MSADPIVRPRIALVHAVAVAMAPIEAAFAKLWPEAERMNLLDDALSVDRSKTIDLSARESARIEALADYAIANGADAVLFTCSAFGPAIEAAAARHVRPVLKPNEAMFSDALRRGTRIGMIATFEPSVSSMTDEFHQAARAAGVPRAELISVLVPEAMAALRSGDHARHNALVAEAARRLEDCEAIMLAQFSTSIAAEAVRGAVAVPILTSPESAVGELNRRLGG